MATLSTTEQLNQILKDRILILDGAMGTMIQKHKFTEEDYRGERFKDFKAPLKGNNDLLTLTQPETIEAIHEDFLKAGADIIETNTFNCTSISMKDYEMEFLVTELNKEAAILAKKCADKYTKMDPSKPRFVAGSIGPTNTTASLSPDVNRPGFRAISFEELVNAYTEQVNALLDGGVDILLVETVFDTLNCKAALFAINTIKSQRNLDIPVMVSGTITDASGRTLSGQTPEAFWNSISHGEIFSVGLNCALGAEQMQPHIKELSDHAWCNVSAHPNAGLPNEFGEYDESPEYMSEVLSHFLEEGMLNIVGGCCGTTPEHISAISKLASKYPSRVVPNLKMSL
jgi:5-methyltetrahydrofolate--homocysteine methyltransferase